MTTSLTEREAWKEALAYLLRYEKPDSYRYQRAMRAKGMIEELLHKGTYGELTTERFIEIREALDMVEHRIARDAWITNIHGMVITTNWMDKLAEALSGKTILEIGSHRGCLMQPMNSRGLTWISVQCNPDQDCRFRPIPVENYMDAIKGYRGKVDYLFAAWPALTMRGHDFMEIACAAKAYDIPLLIVAERRVLTSSDSTLWDSQSLYGYRLVQATDFQPARWRGVRDSLWVLVDERHLTQSGDRATFNF